MVAALDTKHVVNAIHTVSIGSLDASLVHPREVFKFAILANASAIIAAHNHALGRSEPSPEDVQVTKRLVEAGYILGIDVLDHIIIGENSFSSLKKFDLMEGHSPAFFPRSLFRADCVYIIYTRRTM